MAIPQSFIQELVARADVVEIVGRYVQLKKAGANFSGLCPFHSEKSPSFTVSPSKQFYHCFGCGKNGNAIGFLMDHTGMGFIEAVKDLAGQYGMQVPEEDLSPQQRERAAEQRALQNTLTGVLEKAAEAYRRHLKETPRVIDYCKGRGLSGDIARRFGLGYAPQGWRSLASVFPSYDDPQLVESGLVILNQEDAQEEKRYDRFRDRLMFPIRNVKGDCIGFGGRVLGDDKPKYLNSPETPVFSKGRELYGLFEARTAVREQGFVLVTEGYMDVVALAQLGFANVVATLGTACTADHVQKLFRFTDAVVFSFDGDAAGRRAARKALEGALPYATDVRNVKFLFLPAEHDPDSFIRANGHAAFGQCIDVAVPLSRFLIDAASEGCDLLTAEGRSLMASHARPLWSQLPDGALKRQLLGEIAALVQLPAQDLTQLWGPPDQPLARAHDPHRQVAGGARDGQQTSTDRWRRSTPARRTSGRSMPASRADHAARILLGHMTAWDLFSAEDHALLCHLPKPHGELFVWLEHEMHERGAQPWGAIREGLRDHAAQELALRVMADPQLATVDDHRDAVQELRNLLQRMLIEQLKEQETREIEAAQSDPQALQRYRELLARRLLLESATRIQP
ncbi:MAG: DNA primase [Burkholderiaceae bacterium]